MIHVDDFLADVTNALLRYKSKSGGISHASRS